MAASLSAQQAGFFPLSDIRPGMLGTGKTVFSGSRIDEFQVEILGVLENTGPRQSLILARLSGGPLATTGVLQGMSGSPVYIGGRLVGAVAMAFPYSKEPIAAIRPIEDLIRASERTPPRAQRARVSLTDTDLGRGLEPAQAVTAGGLKFVDIATPVSFGGFASKTIEFFAPQLRALGLEPLQGISGSARLRPGLGDPAALQPGSMISVQLLAGDMSIGADGTLTYIDGRQVYAFGHRFLSIGNTEIPFARAEVLALLPSLSSSFKISAPREWMGTISNDRSTGVAGELGRQAAMVPLTISITPRSGQSAAAKRVAYQMEMVNDAVLSPLLLQMAMMSAIDATERSGGDATLAVRGEIRFQGGGAPIRLGNSYAGNLGVAQQASIGAAVPLAYALQSGFDSFKLKDVRIEIDSFDERRQAQIDQVWTSRKQVQPGEPVELTVVLAGPDGAETSRKVTYRVPIGAPTGPMYFTVADGNTTNLTEYRQLLNTNPRTPGQLVNFLNTLRDNTKAYVRVWRAQEDYDIQGQNMPAPPPSVEQILARSQTGLGAILPSRNSKVAELQIGADGLVVTGNKTVQVEIKE